MTRPPEKLIEGVLAAFAQFDNDCLSDRTRAGMKASLELGRWVFLAPLGYINALRAMGKSLMGRLRAGTAGATGVQGVRHRALHEGTPSRADESLRLVQPARPAAHVPRDWDAAEKSALGRHRGCTRVRRPREE
jgi:hypothetical protein